MSGQGLGSVHPAVILRSSVTVGSANPRVGKTGEMHSFVHLYNIKSQRSRKSFLSRLQPKAFDVTKFEWVNIKRSGLRRALNTGMQSMQRTKLGCCLTSILRWSVASPLFHIGLRRCPILQCVNHNTLERRWKTFLNKHRRKSWGLFYASWFY